MSKYSTNYKRVSLADKCSIPEYDIIYEYIKYPDDSNKTITVKFYWYNNSFLGINKKGLIHINKVLNLKYVETDVIPNTRNIHTLDFCDRITDVKLRQTFNNFRYKLSIILLYQQIYENESDPEDCDDCEDNVTKDLIKQNTTSNEIVLMQSSLERYESLLEEYKTALVKQSAEITDYKDTMIKLCEEVSEIKQEGFVKTLNVTHNILHSLQKIEVDQIYMLAYCSSKVIHVYYVEFEIDPEEESIFDANCEYEFYFNEKPYTHKKYNYVDSLWVMKSETHLEHIKNCLHKTIKSKTVIHTGTYNRILEAHQEYLVESFNKFKTKIAKNAVVGSDITKRLSDIIKKFDILTHSDE